MFEVSELLAASTQFDPQVGHVSASLILSVVEVVSAVEILSSSVLGSRD